MYVAHPDGCCTIVILRYPAIQSAWVVQARGATPRAINRPARTSHWQRLFTARESNMIVSCLNTCSESRALWACPSLLVCVAVLVPFAGCTIVDMTPGADSPMTDTDDPQDDEMTPLDGLPAETETRLPFTTQCSEFAGLCTSSFPTPVLSVLAAPGQTVTENPDATGFIVEGVDDDGGEVVLLQGSASAPGNTATALAYSWTSGAADGDPCTRAPGDEFSTEADPEITLQTGVHYIRLTVQNDVPLVGELLPQDLIDQCGTLTQQFKFDFVEVVVEVRN